MIIDILLGRVNGFSKSVQKGFKTLRLAKGRDCRSTGFLSLLAGFWGMEWTGQGKGGFVVVAGGFGFQFLDDLQKIQISR